MKKALLIFLLAASSMYAAFLYILPVFMKSHIFLDAVDDILADKTGIVLKSENFNVKTYPSLLVYISAAKFDLTSENKELLKADNAAVLFDLKSFKIKKADIDYIYINSSHFKNLNSSVKIPKHKQAFNLNLKQIPELNIKKAQIWAEQNEENTILINAGDIIIQNFADKTECAFSASITSNLLEKPLYTDKNSRIHIKDGKVFVSNLKLTNGNAHLSADGLILDSRKRFDFTLKSDDIPVSDVMAGILYFQNLRDKSKKFIENFYDYSGALDADLRITNEGIFGSCIIDNLAGKTVLFNVPVLFKKVPFEFNGRTVSAAAYGVLGSEKVYTDVIMNNIISKDFETNGSVSAVLTNKTIGRYIPDASAKGAFETLVKYHIKNRKINVNYRLILPKGADIFYKNADLQPDNKIRQINAETFKDGEKIKLVNYDYSVIETPKESHGQQKKIKIITGDGLFSRINGRIYRPDYISARTENDAPVAAAGYFYKYLHGGFFRGNLKYDFNSNKITGNFAVKNSKFKHYHVENAKIDAREDKVIIQASGFYKNSPFKADISGLNNFNGKIKIYSLDLFLDELNVNTNRRHNIDKSKIDIKNNERRIKSASENFDINLYTVTINKLLYRRALIKDIYLTGRIKNDIFDFDVKRAKFANGLLTAKGFYDFNLRKSDTVFTADNIDADIAADTLFNMKGQVKGAADGVLCVKTTNGIYNRTAHVNFDIKHGYMPRFGKTKFVLKKAKLFKKSFTLDDIFNIDMSNMEEFASDIEGSFDTRNEFIENINLQLYNNKYIALFAEGSYNAKKQDADINIFGIYNKKEISKIKVFNIPLQLLLKIVLRPENSSDKYKKEIKSIPELPGAKSGDTKLFRIKITGNMSSDNIKTELKSIAPQTPL